MSTLTIEVLRKYLNRIFVETGTNTGEGIAVALATGGFTDIRSVELAHDLYERAKGLFSNKPEVKLYYGDSVNTLWDMIKDINEPITFWLDAHPPAGYTPMMAELNVIARHPIKTHSVLIDDVRLWESWGLTVEQVQNRLLKINDKYKFYREPNFVKPDDIFAAKV